MLSKETPKKLFLLDAYALIFRAYYAFIKNPRINSKGLNTSAMFGFTNVMLDILKKEKPSHMAVVFDPHEETIRVAEFPEYKANRDETPEDIKLAFPYIVRIIEAMNIPVYQVSKYEADDVIGTLAKKAENAGFTTYMMTSDKDYGNSYQITYSSIAQAAEAARPIFSVCLRCAKNSGSAMCRRLSTFSV